MDCQGVIIDLIETGKYQNISRDFLQVNPGATVPVLLHNGHPVYESHEQVSYVAEQVDASWLLVPKDPVLRECMREWLHKTSLIGDDPIAAPEATAGNAVPGLTIPIFASMVAKIPALKILKDCYFIESSSGRCSFHDETCWTVEDDDLATSRSHHKSLSSGYDCASR